MQDRVVGSVAVRVVAAGLTAFALIGAAPAAASVFRVDRFDDSRDAVAGDGRCADEAGRCSLRAALSEAAAGAVTAVELPAGTYEIGATLELPAGLRLAGAGPASTVIAPGPGFPTAPTPGRIVSAAQPGEPAVLSGFTLDGRGMAAGIAVERGASLQLRSLVIRNAQSDDDGAGLRAEGNVVAVGVSIVDNVSKDKRARGGGVLLQGAAATLTDVAILGNRGGAAGGMFVRGGTVRAERLQIVGNVGAVGYQQNPESSMELAGSWFGDTRSPTGRRRPDCRDSGGDRIGATADSFISHGDNRIDLAGPPDERGPESDLFCGPAIAGDRFGLDLTATESAWRHITDTAGLIRAEPAAAQAVAGAVVGVDESGRSTHPRWWPLVAAAAGIAVVALVLRSRRPG